jgi:hypothetical protein
MLNARYCDRLLVNICYYFSQYPPTRRNKRASGAIQSSGEVLTSNLYIPHNASSDPPTLDLIITNVWKEEAAQQELAINYKSNCPTYLSDVSLIASISRLSR